MAAELVGACTGGAALTAWALHLGCSPAVIGLLGALPYLAHLLQLPAARLTARFGPRRVALTAVALSRQAFLPLALLPLWPAGAGRAEPLLLCAAAVLHGAGIVCNNGWVAWIGDLVPRRIRGRYFGRRSALTTAAGSLCGLAAGALLDRAHAAPGRALPVLAAAACVTGAVSTWLMARQGGGHLRVVSGAARPRPLPFAAVLRVPAARRLVTFQAMAGVAAGLSAPQVGVYLVRDRGHGFAFLAGCGALTGLARMATAPRWGRAVDRPGGARRVLALTTLLASAAPLLWILAARAGGAPVLLEATLTGVAAAGLGVAGLALPLALAPPPDRPVYHAVLALAGGLGFAAGAALGPLLALGGLAGPLTLPFALSAGLRLCAAGLALRLI